MSSEVSYNPETGALSGASTHKSGADYLACMFEGKSIFAHRVAFYLMEGRWPEQIDHINGDRKDNRWANLREVTNRENALNSKKRSDNTSGVTGVYWAKHRQKWQVRIGTPENRCKHLGYFTNKDEAIAVRKAAEREQGYHENHGR